MNKFFRFIIAAWGAKKMGGGCLSTIIIFIIIYVALGKCNNTRAAVKPVKAHRGLFAVLQHTVNKIK